MSSILSSESGACLFSTSRRSRSLMPTEAAKAACLPPRSSRSRSRLMRAPLVTYFFMLVLVDDGQMVLPIGPAKGRQFAGMPPAILGNMPVWASADGFFVAYRTQLPASAPNNIPQSLASWQPPPPKSVMRSRQKNRDRISKTPALHRPPLPRQPHAGTPPAPATLPGERCGLRPHSNSPSQHSNRQLFRGPDFEGTPVVKRANMVPPFRQKQTMHVYSTSADS